jgi:hypothetical protein
MRRLTPAWLGLLGGALSLLQYFVSSPATRLVFSG